MTEAVLDRNTLRADVFAAVEALRVAGELDGRHPVWLTMPGPEVEPRELLALLGDPTDAAESDAVVWENAEESFAGWGVASSIRVDDALDRFEQVRREVESFDLGAFVVDREGTVGAATNPPRWFGGFAYESGPVEDTSPWAGFGAGWFVLPRLSVRRIGDRTEWALVIDAEEAGRPTQAEAVVLLSWLWDRVETEPTGAHRKRAADAQHSSPHAPRRFSRSIRDAVDSIRRGTLEKVVAATHVDVELGASPALDELLGSWSEGALESTRFLFRRDGEAFLGATPERLIRKVGRRVQTSALAGTAPKDEVGSEARAGRRTASRLLASAKNRSEHDFVVRHLVECLEPVCASLQVSDELSILELRDLLHLQTPIEGQLREDRHVLELVASMHPTPAVCGFPADPARQWIQEHEEVRRGWYSGPVGWLDAEDNGDFQVALRSMLLSARDPQTTAAREAGLEAVGYRSARLYAGVGLVQDSRVQEEMDEVDAKLLTAGRALVPWIRGPQRSFAVGSNAEDSSAE